MLFRHVSRAGQGCRLRLAALLLLMPWTLTAPKIAAAGGPPVPVILDTDMGGDCDDVGALFILHGAQQRGEVRLLATIGCISADAIAPCLDAINTWFGHPEIPVGTLKDPGLLVGPHYTAEIARRYPHRYASGRDYPDAVTLYRRLLARQPDNSVVLVAIGPLRNLANLLRSTPDSASPLSGRALAAQKIKQLLIMGGRYGGEASATEAEWNFAQDAPSAALVCAKWPTPILFNGEGGSTSSGRRVTFEMPEHNPLTLAYRLYPDVGFARDRLSWDPITCLTAAHGPQPWYDVVEGGVNDVDPRTGVNTWRKAAPDDRRKHGFLTPRAPKARVETALEDWMTAGRGRPADLTFNTATYAPYLCAITASGAPEVGNEPGRAFDRDERTAWTGRATHNWIQCRYVDGRKYRVTSYAVVCRDPARAPGTIELSGSNDGGATWRRIDLQTNPRFTGQAPRREFQVAHPDQFNAYRLNLSAQSGSGAVEIGSIELNQRIRCRPGVLARSLTLDRQSITLPVNGRATINADLSPNDCWERQPVWKSSDPAVAEVRRVGEQVAIVVGRRPGRCLLTATVGRVKQVCAVTVTPSTLPTGWRYDELASPAIPGAVAVSGDAFTLTGCGHAMTSFWERDRDQGAFASRSAAPEAALSARLAALTPNVGGSAYGGDRLPPTVAGLMVRETLTRPCGRFVAVQVDPTGSLVCRWRDRSGDQDDNQMQDLGKVTLPVCLKLEQVGGQIRVYTGSDGVQWGAPRLVRAAAFDTGSRLGLFVCSGSAFSSTTATFDSVR